jgi:ribonucleotide monophosphatase NagD (HAD superfamily)
MGLQVAEKLRGGRVLKSRILGIGDAVRTDLVSAAGAGVDALFIAQGLHRDELLRDGKLDAGRLSALLTRSNARPKATMVGLLW